MEEEKKQTSNRVKEEMNQIRAEEYAMNPGLERFQKIKKNLMILMMLLILVNKLITAGVTLSTSGAAAAPIAIAVGLIIGMCIPGIFALAIYRGPWKSAFAFFLLGGPPAFQILQFITQIPQLSAHGVSILDNLPLMFSFITEVAYTAIILGMAIWLTVPVRSRELGQAANRMGGRMNAFIKENQPPQI